MDAARYLDPSQLYKIMEGEKRKAEIAIGLMPKFYNANKTKVNLPQNLHLGIPRWYTCIYGTPYPPVKNQSRKHLSLIIYATLIDIV